VKVVCFKLISRFTSPNGEYTLYLSKRVAFAFIFLLEFPHGDLLSLSVNIMILNSTNRLNQIHLSAPSIFRSFHDASVRSFFAQRPRFKNVSPKSAKNVGDHNGRSPVNVNTSSSSSSPAANNAVQPSIQNPNQTSSSPGSPPISGQASQTSETSGFQLKLVHVILFCIIFLGGALFATMTLQVRPPDQP
jgi:hypothetical protein